MRRLETVRTQEEGWQEPCESGGSRTDLWERGGEIPLRYPTRVMLVTTLMTYLAMVFLVITLAPAFLVIRSMQTNNCAHHASSNQNDTDTDCR